jgi:hypothetical protein
LLSAGLTPGGEPLGPTLHLAALIAVYAAIAVAAVRRYQYA